MGNTQPSQGNGETGGGRASRPSPSHRTRPPFPDVEGVVLAGGKSRRFGENKALARVEGVPLVERALGVLRPLFPRVLLVTNDPDSFRFLEVPMVEDRIKGLGPIGGIHTALHTIEHPYAFVAACDMPALNPVLVRRLVALRRGYDVVIPRIGKWLEPLHAVYSTACIGPVEGLINRGVYQIFRFFPQVRVRYVDKEELMEADPHLNSLYNINTREDLRRFLASVPAPPADSAP